MTTMTTEAGTGALDAILEEARERWAAWRAEHPRPSNEVLEAMSFEEANALSNADGWEYVHIADALIPSDDVTIAVLARDARVLGAKLDFTPDTPRDAIALALRQLIGDATLNHEGQR